MAKEETYKGKTPEELKRMSVDDFMKLTTARQRRSLKRGLNDAQKMLLARVRKFNDELFLAPEVVRVVDPSWELLRRVELLASVGKFDRSLPARDLYNEIKEPVVEVQEKDVSVSARQKVLSFIERVEEAAIAAIVQDVGAEGQLLIKELLKEGEIYQSKPGYVRIV